MGGQCASLARLAKNETCHSFGRAARSEHLGVRREGANMLGLEGSGSSDEEEEVARVETTGPVPVDATAPDRGTRATDLGARPGGMGTAEPEPRVSALPSAAALFDAKEKGTGGVSIPSPGVPGVGGSILGSKRSASGSFPISGVAQKSNRSETRAVPGGKPRSSLLPPQLRGRANNATQDLEGMGLKRKPAAGAKPPSGGG